MTLQVKVLATKPDNYNPGDSHVGMSPQCTMVHAHTQEISVFKLLSSHKKKGKPQKLKIKVETGTE